MPIRDHDAPPATTDGADGSPVMVPTEAVFGPRPPIPHNYNGRADGVTVRSVNRGLAEMEVTPNTSGFSVSPAETPAENRVARARAAAANVVVLGDPPKKEDPT